MGRKGALTRIGSGIDFRSFGEAVSYPGIDPRQWISYGIVEGSSENDPDPEVVFDPEYGPLVKVILYPSTVPIRARVSSMVAGNGEGEYHPFIKGDEVLVAIPEGSEQADCAIIGRMNNSVDKFPTGSVAGQDPTLNNFGFSRRRTPYIMEVQHSYLIRSAISGAMIGIDETGGILLSAGTGNPGFQMTPDIIGMSNNDGSAMLQLDLTNNHAIMQIGEACIILSDSNASPETNIIATPGVLTIATNGQPAMEHVISTEAVLNIIYQICQKTVPPITEAQIIAALVLASKTPLSPTLGSAIAGIFSSPTQIPKPIALGYQTMPGIGCNGLMCG